MEIIEKLSKSIENRNNLTKEEIKIVKSVRKDLIGLFKKCVKINNTRAKMVKATNYNREIDLMDNCSDIEEMILNIECCLEYNDIIIRNPFGDDDQEIDTDGDYYMGDENDFDEDVDEENERRREEYYDG